MRFRLAPRLPTVDLLLLFCKSGDDAAKAGRGAAVKSDRADAAALLTACIDPSSVPSLRARYQPPYES